MRRWTDDEIIQALRDWEATFGSPPAYKDWRASDPDGLHPTAETVRTRLGSWTAGKAVAFPPPGLRKPPGYWTRERIIEALRVWANEHDGLPPGKADLVLRNGLPNCQTIVKRFGSKARAMKAAGLIERPSAITNRQIAKYLPFNRKP